MTQVVRIRWGYRPLKELLPALEQELARAIKPEKVVAEVPFGAFVMLERRPDGRRLVSIGRAKRPEGVGDLAKWADEVGTFQEHLGLRGWRAVPCLVKQGIGVAFLEPVVEPSNQLAGL